MGWLGGEKYLPTSTYTPVEIWLLGAVAAELDVAFCIFASASALQDSGSSFQLFDFDFGGIFFSANGQSSELKLAGEISF